MCFDFNDAIYFRTMLFNLNKINKKSRKYVKIYNFNKYIA